MVYDNCEFREPAMAGDGSEQAVHPIDAELKVISTIILAIDLPVVNENTRGYGIRPHYRILPSFFIKNVKFSQNFDLQIACLDNENLEDERHANVIRLTRNSNAGTPDTLPGLYCKRTIETF